MRTDHLNTPCTAADTNQIVVWRWDSYAFGQGKPDTDQDSNGKKAFVLLRFPGQIASEKNCNITIIGIMIRRQVETISDPLDPLPLFEFLEISVGTVIGAPEIAELRSAGTAC